MARVGDERAPDLAAELGANRDVLQVGIAAAQTPGRRPRLVEARVHAAGLRVDQLRQRIDVRAFQLLQRPPLEDEARQLVREGELLEHFHGGRRGLRLHVPLERGELQFLEQDLRELRR